jgi:hypothetical protein
VHSRRPRIRKTMGVKLPRKFNKITVILALVKANYLMKKVSKEVLLKYRKVSNPLKIAVIQIINTLVTYCFQMRKVDMMATLVLVNTTLILCHGFTDETGSTLSAFGTILAWSGDFSKG